MAERRPRHGTITEYSTHRCRCEPCRLAAKIYTHGYRQRNRDRFRNAHIKHLYGVTNDWYDAQLAKQQGVCAICGRADRRKKLAIDHDHETDQIRGLLCVSCNRNISWFETRRTQIIGYLDPRNYCDQA